MLQEMTEEWEQCERKLRECREWCQRSRQSLLDPLHARRRPLRDQVAAGERAAAEVAVQKQKAVMAVEKLQVRQGPQCAPVKATFERNSCAREKRRNTTFPLAKRSQFSRNWNAPVADLASL